MSELEQLRKEINELRERVSVLECRANMPVHDGCPLWSPAEPNKWPTYPGGTVCSTQEPQT
jgi:hypothetical protein